MWKYSVLMSIYYVFLKIFFLFLFIIYLQRLRFAVHIFIFIHFYFCCSLLILSFFWCFCDGVNFKYCWCISNDVSLTSEMDRTHAFKENLLFAPITQLKRIFYWIFGEINQNEIPLHSNNYKLLRNFLVL